MTVPTYSRGALRALHEQRRRELDDVDAYVHELVERATRGVVFARRNPATWEPFAQRWTEGRLHVDALADDLPYSLVDELEPAMVHVEKGRARPTWKRREPADAIARREALARVGAALRLLFG